MSWTVRAPLVIVVLAAVPAGIAVEVTKDAGSWPGWIALGGAALSLGCSAALWLRRPDDRAPLLPGFGGAILVLAMAGIGLLRGTTEEPPVPRPPAPAAPTPNQPGGWLGRTTRDGAAFFAMELEAEDPTAKKIGAMFERKFVPIIVTVDNSGGTTPVELDLARARLDPVPAGGDAVLPRDSVLDSARGGREIAHKLHGGRYVVPPGGRLRDGLVFVDPARALDKITGLTVIANGKSLTIPGRFYSAEERQALSSQKRE